MNAIRSTALVNLFITFPLLIWATGELIETQSNTKTQYVIQQAIQIFWFLHIISACMTIPVFSRYISFPEKFLTVFISLLIPLPLLILSWLIGSIPWLSIIKYSVFFIITSSICLFLISIVNKSKIPACLLEETNSFLCLLAGAFILDNHVLWLSWLAN